MESTWVDPIPMFEAIAHMTQGYALIMPSPIGHGFGDVMAHMAQAMHSTECRPYDSLDHV